MEVNGEVSMLERRDLNKKGDYSMSCFVVSLRGCVGFMMDASGLRHHIGKGREGTLAHAVIPLMGRFKGYTVRRHHLRYFINKTSSKLKVIWLVEILNDELIRQGQINSRACCDEEGNLDQASHYQETFVHFLTEV